MEKEKKFKVINGGNTYRMITPEEAVAILEADNSNTKDYAFVDEEMAERYNQDLEDGDIRIRPGMHRLQLNVDVEGYVREYHVKQFAIKVGNIGDILMHMDE